MNGEAEGIDFAIAFTGNPVSIVDSANLTLTDPNNTAIAGATITITNLLDGAAEVLTADFTGTNITGDYDSATGTLTLSGEDTLTNYQQALGTLTYNNTATAPDTADRAIAFTVSDGGIHSNTSALAMTTLSFTSTPATTDDMAITLGALSNGSNPGTNHSLAFGENRDSLVDGIPAVSDNDTPIKRSLSFIAGDFLANLMAGLLITLGLTRVIFQILRRFGEVVYLFQFLLGIALVIKRKFEESSLLEES